MARINDEASLHSEPMIYTELDETEERWELETEKHTSLDTLRFVEPELEIRHPSNLEESEIQAASKNEKLISPILSRTQVPQQGTAVPPWTYGFRQCGGLSEY